MKEKKLSLTSQIFIGLLSGLVLGVLVHYFLPAGPFKDRFLINGLFQLFGTGFMRLMQMLVVPLVFFSIVTGAMSIGDTKRLGKVGLKTLAFYIVTTALAIIIALSFSQLTNPGIGLNLSEVKTAQTEIAKSAATGIDMVLDIIPKNPIESLTSGNMLQIIFFALFLGIILASLGNHVPVITRFMNEANEVMMTMTFNIMKAAPVGVFALIAKTFSDIGFDGFLPMVKYMLTVSGGLAIQLVAVYGLLLFIFTRTNPFTFFKRFSPVLGFAFSTASSGATVPVNIQTLEDMGVSKKISSFTIPLGATINMDGTAIMQGVAVIFVAQAFGIHLELSDFLTVIGTATMASIGTAAVPGVGLITLAMVFNSVGLPVEGIGLIMGIDRVLDMARTAVNCSGDAVVTTIVAHQEGLFNKASLYKAKSVDEEDYSNLDDVEI